MESSTLIDAVAAQSHLQGGRDVGLVHLDHVGSMRATWAASTRPRAMASSPVFWNADRAGSD